MEALAYMRNANFLISFFNNFFSFFLALALDIFRYLDNSRYISIDIYSSILLEIY